MDSSTTCSEDNTSLTTTILPETLNLGIPSTAAAQETTSSIETEETIGSFVDEEEEEEEEDIAPVTIRLSELKKQLLTKYGVDLTHAEYYFEQTSGRHVFNVPTKADFKANGSDDPMPSPEMVENIASVEDIYIKRANALEDDIRLQNLPEKEYPDEDIDDVGDFIVSDMVRETSSLKRKRGCTTEEGGLPDGIDPANIILVRPKRACVAKAKKEIKKFIKFFKSKGSVMRASAAGDESDARAEQMDTDPDLEHEQLSVEEDGELSGVSEDDDESSSSGENGGEESDFDECPSDSDYVPNKCSPDEDECDGATKGGAASQVAIVATTDLEEESEQESEEEEEEEEPSETETETEMEDDVEEGESAETSTTTTTTTATTEISAA